MTSTIVVGPFEQNTLLAGYAGEEADNTFIAKVHVCPPIFKAKLAVPDALGVPEMV
jgi:hypothetical protein